MKRQKAISAERIAAAVKRSDARLADRNNAARHNSPSHLQDLLNSVAAALANGMATVTVTLDLRINVWTDLISAAAGNKTTIDAVISEVVSESDYLLELGTGDKTFTPEPGGAERGQS